jgi:DNA mismatch repair protein MutS
MARYIAERLKSMTLFATHYFELTALAQDVDGCANVHLDATEHGDEIVFLHAVREGPADRSYGLQVAQLAGVPREVIRRAREYLTALEAQRDARQRPNPQAELPLFAASPQEPSDPLREAVLALDPDAMAPRDALQALYRLRQLVE